MNIIDIQDNLKNFSEKQLINEMQRPSGNAPQFLVLSEITRRKRMRDQFKSDQAAKEQTVAQEAVAAAGVPQGGIMGMSEAMAPKASMAEGGIGSVMSAPMKAPMGAMPMSEGGIMSMSAGGASKPRIEERRMKSGKIGLFQGNTFLGTKQDRDDDGDSLAKKIGFGGDRDIIGSIKDVLGFEEGGVIKAQNGLPLGLRQNNPGNIRPGAGFIGETGQGGGYSTFASEDEGLRAIQRLLMTYGDQYGLNTIRGLANRYAPKSENPTESYIDFISQKTGIGPDEEIDLAGRGSDLIPAIVGFEQGQQPFSQAQIDRAIRAAGTDDPDMVRQILAEDLAPQEKVTSNFSLMDMIFPKAQATTMDAPVQQDDEGFSFKGLAQSLLGPEGRRLADIETEADIQARAGSRSGEQIGEREQFTKNLVADKAIQDSDAYQDHVRRAASAGVKPKSPSEFRDFFQKGKKGESPADRFLIGGDAPEELESAVTIAESGAEAAVRSPEFVPEIVEATTETIDQTTQEGQRAGEQRGERAEFEESLKDSDKRSAQAAAGQSVATGGADAKDAAGKKTTDLVKQLQDALGKDQKATGLEGEIQALQSKLEKDRETDKYLALAQAGLALMSSKNPRLLGAIGEAGISGLKAMREAQDRYSEGVIDLINARAKLRKSADTNVLSKDVLLREAINLETDAAKPENFESRDALLSRAAQLRGMAGGPAINVASTS